MLLLKPFPSYFFGLKWVSHKYLGLCGFHQKFQSRVEFLNGKRSGNTARSLHWLILGLFYALFVQWSCLQPPDKLKLVRYARKLDLVSLARLDG